MDFQVFAGFHKDSDAKRVRAKASPRLTPSASASTSPTPPPSPPRARQSPREVELKGLAGAHTIRAVRWTP
jgi:hypothetical protein